jgi:hypothetical protein
MRVLFIVACRHGLKAVAGEQAQNIRPRHVIGTVLQVADFIRRNGTWSGLEKFARAAAAASWLINRQRVGSSSEGGFAMFVRHLL